jgi:hypothetical protein
MPVSLPAAGPYWLLGLGGLAGAATSHARTCVTWVKRRLTFDVLLQGDAYKAVAW